jgi:hypothetical protein
MAFDQFQALNVSELIDHNLYDDGALNARLRAKGG